eukprot:TRINITY_DN2808_c0_g1_i1.p2 TRINITY_DN2808_c0_g1~~TRINITY_DN2808_c0_g1_i1.p2  ORF type:complete len:489 (+),score=132.32 TRINITY_DN2808_c0_g1_i1:1650-3116(+)
MFKQCSNATLQSFNNIIRGVSHKIQSNETLPYVVHSNETRKQMYEALGIKSEDELFNLIPLSAKITPGSLNLEPPKSEMTIKKELSAMAEKNLSAADAPLFCGAGMYRHYVPAFVDHLISRSEFLTCYTPYQPEVSQGTLQGMFEFQNLICRLTGMGIANASMYDGSTATAEAINMACRLTKRGKVLLEGSIHPQYLDVCRTYNNASNIADLKFFKPNPQGIDIEGLIKNIDKKTAAVVVQNPGFFGHVVDLSPLARACEKNGAKLIVVTNEIVSLGAIKSPGEMGADIVCGDCGTLGNGLNFGGPTAGFLATRNDPKTIRTMPGRLVGETKDVEGNRCYVLSLGTREQHIKREKATSNICTAAGVNALAFAMHVAALGSQGYHDLAQMNHANARLLANSVEGKLGKGSVLNHSYFNEITVELPHGIDANDVVEELVYYNILGGVPVSRLLPNQGFDNLLLLAATETNTEEEIEYLTDALQEIINRRS